MRKAVVDLLACPNGFPGPLRLHALEAHRDGARLRDPAALRPDDEIVRGVLANLDAGTAYPIADSLGLLLSDVDTETGRHVELLDISRGDCPEPFRRAIDATLARLRGRAETEDGRWNREEMAYYDREVATAELRERLLEDIRAKPLWNIFLPRERHLIRPIASRCRGRFVLEVGCGNARTVSWIFDPARHGHRYVGFDVSWDRLLLAKAALPAGDFLQASAMNPPFRTGVFQAVLGFGVFHHLPRPAEGLRRCLALLAPGGYAGLHEPIRTPKLLPDGSRARRAAERLLSSYEHSEHDNEIDLGETLALLREARARILGVHYSHSPVRPLLNRLCGAISAPRAHRRAYELTISLDQLVLRTAGRLSPRLGPRAVSLLAQVA
jgi:SAM-dependent methyltransferase/uncharacterized protein YbaR (Trm112 family)